LTDTAAIHERAEAGDLRGRVVRSSRSLMSPDSGGLSYSYDYTYTR
jgi:hypothetical protein